MLYSAWRRSWGVPACINWARVAEGHPKRGCCRTPRPATPATRRWRSRRGSRRTCSRCNCRRLREIVQQGWRGRRRIERRRQVERCRARSQPPSVHPSGHSIFDVVEQRRISRPRVNCDNEWRLRSSPRVADTSDASQTLCLAAICIELR